MVFSKLSNFTQKFFELRVEQERLVSTDIKKFSQEN